jgi:NAD(P)-dependent dehydrogenase (short-subunit alcohol dehydrogenase family)
MPGELNGRVVVITGAARGLGRDYARYFAADGASVVLADINDTSSATADAARHGGPCIGIECDVTDRASVDELVATAVSQFGRLDILVSNAGLWRGLGEASLLTVSAEVWSAAIAVNMTGCLYCYQACVPVMAQRGWGRIVNVSSMASHSGPGVYGMTKMAVNRLTHAMAAEVGDLGITVNCVAPGLSAFEAAGPNQLPDADEIVARAIVKRVGTSRDLYAAIRYLCSDEASWTTGQTLHVNGGTFAVY